MKYQPKDSRPPSLPASPNGLCASCPLHAGERENLDALLALRASIEHLESHFEALMQLRLKHHAGAAFPEGRPARIRGISEEKLMNSKTKGTVLDRLIVTSSNGDPPRIWAAVALDDLSPLLKALLLILEEDGAAPTGDGLVPWKSKSDIARRLPLPPGDAEARKPGTVRQLILRLRRKFAERGLDPELIETEWGKTRSQSKARLRRRSSAPGGSSQGTAPNSCDDQNPG